MVFFGGDLQHLGHLTFCGVAQRVSIHPASQNPGCQEASQSPNRAARQIAREGHRQERLPKKTLKMIQIRKLK